MEGSRDFEKELLTLKISALESFMCAVCKELKCLPSFADPLPTGGNSHAMEALANLKEGATASTNSAIMPCLCKSWEQIPCGDWHLQVVDNCPQHGYILREHNGTAQ